MVDPAETGLNRCADIACARAICPATLHSRKIIIRVDRQVTAAFMVRKYPRKTEAARAEQKFREQTFVPFNERGGYEINGA